MELIESDNKQPVLVEPEPRYQPIQPSKNEEGHTWIRLVLTILAGIILVALIVLLARWIYHTVHHKTVTVPPVSVSTPNTQSSNTPVTPAQPASPSNNQNSGSASSSSSTSNSSTTNQITNTGPGDVAGLFIGASLAAGGLHYIISVRRFARNYQ